MSEQKLSRQQKPIEGTGVGVPFIIPRHSMIELEKRKGAHNNA
jgi:hypothetical protein